MLHAKSEQDRTLPADQHYIRSVLEIPMSESLDDEDDVPGDTDSNDAPLRIVVCMSKAGSERLCQAQYVQSDIGFKRVVGFHEFEIAGMDRDANTSAYPNFL